jgi:hypothetical protein
MHKCFRSNDLADAAAWLQRTQATRRGLDRKVMSYVRLPESEASPANALSRRLIRVIT